MLVDDGNDGRTERLDHNRELPARRQLVIAVRAMEDRCPWRKPCDGAGLHNSAVRKPPEIEGQIRRRRPYVLDDEWGVPSIRSPKHPGDIRQINRRGGLKIYRECSGPTRDQGK